MTSDFQEFWFNAQAHVLKSFESEPLSKLPALKKLVLEDKIFACPYVIEDDNGVKHEFILFDLERYVDRPIDFDKTYNAMMTYQDDIFKAYYRYLDSSRDIN
jgi:hypothetical protein